MISITQLLRHARNAAAQINAETDKPEHRTTPGAVGVILHELLLREDPAFYLDHLTRGKTLLTEGRQLAAARDKALPEPVTLRDDEQDYTLWRIEGKPRTEMYIKRLDGDYTNAAGLVNRIKDVIGAPPGIVPISLYGPIMGP